MANVCGNALERGRYLPEAKKGRGSTCVTGIG